MVRNVVCRGCGVHLGYVIPRGRYCVVKVGDRFFRYRYDSISEARQALQDAHDIHGLAQRNIGTCWDLERSYPSSRKSGSGGCAPRWLRMLNFFAPVCRLLRVEGGHA